MLSELYSGVSGLIDAGTAYGIRVPPSTRVVFHLAKVELGDVGVGPLDFAKIYTLSELLQFASPTTETKPGASPPDITAPESYWRSCEQCALYLNLSYGAPTMKAFLNLVQALKGLMDSDNLLFTFENIKNIMNLVLGLFNKILRSLQLS